MKYMEFVEKVSYLCICDCLKLIGKMKDKETDKITYYIHGQIYHKGDEYICLVCNKIRKLDF